MKTAPIHLQGQAAERYAEAKTKRVAQPATPLPLDSPPMNADKRAALTTATAGVVHDLWRAPRLQADGSYEPRLKATIDEQWKLVHSQDEVDIANTVFEDLPTDWQEENWLSAEVAVTAVLAAVAAGAELSSEFMEEAADGVHEAWLQRNRRYASPEQQRPYRELSAEEQAKDLFFVETAVNAYQASIG